MRGGGGGSWVLHGYAVIHVVFSLTVGGEVVATALCVQQQHNNSREVMFMQIFTSCF